ncbi:DEAD/DEAH box helicase [Oceanibacterium hippocampi]|uniref:DEAD/DEAH box helicase n=1 Tax=Oceanibacterium hippocampi TaxID=745714 RepID=UPI001C3888AF|nr:DEAD/DEAH box helicase [Oceanibacterium hippocampi]
MDSTTFTALGLAEPLLRALNDLSYAEPTPIQARSIPLLLEGRDMLGIAQTGTGKTAAFALPLLHHLITEPARPQPKTTRALILAPTRELAVQIGEQIRAYGRHVGLRHAVIFGGVPHKNQNRSLSRGVDIVVATPGRLLDHMEHGSLRLDEVSHLVLDEADRMLDMGFQRDVQKILKALPMRRQSLLFSATMPASVAELAARILKNPERVEVTPKAITVDLIDQSVHYVDAGRKQSLLGEILADESLNRVIVFTRTKHRADRLALQLEKHGISTDSLHGNKSQNARQRALQRFRNGDARILVATDIAARGIDVPNVSHVINFELPNEPENYVHRIGRTARAGARGIAISLCEPSEESYLRAIEKLLKQPVAVASGEPSKVFTPPPGRGKNNRGGGRPGGNKPYGNGARPNRSSNNGGRNNRRPDRAAA